MSALVALPEKRYAPDAFAGFDAGVALSHGNARAMAWAAQLAYEDDDLDDDKVQRILAMWGLGRATFATATTASVLPMPGAHALVFGNAGALVIAFRGTDPLVIADWIADLTVLPQHPDVHAGFAAALAAVWPQLTALLREELGAKQLFITGHSLGAALAVLAARRAHDEGFEVDAVYAFGMPRAGNRDFSDAYAPLNDLTYRFVYGDDIVAHVPPSEWDFRHVGHRFSCARRGRFDVSSLANAPNDDDPSFLEDLATEVRGLVDGSVVGAWSMASHTLRSLMRPDSRRTDLVGRMIELLPPALRDHIPDRYWGAL
jgi:triacylglycerol lipase